MPLTFDRNWLSGATTHTLNNQTAVISLFQRGLASDLRGDRSHAESVRDAANAGTRPVKVYKGVHQDRFGTNTAHDQVRIDQAHFNIIFQEKACHVYVQPNLRGEWEITEITGA